MADRLRRRFWVETVLAALSFVFMLLTLLWKDWIEIIFRVDPDNHSGSFEWGIVVASLAIAVIFAVLARLEWRRTAAATA